MAIERIPVDLARDRAGWLALRQHDITASDVPAVCGDGMFGSALKVWAEKRGIVGQSEQTEAMKRGLWGEAAIFEALGMEYPDWELRRAKVYFRDPSIRIGATPDGAAVRPDKEGVGIVQAKFISEWSFISHWLNDPDDDPHRPDAPATAPIAYQLQTLTEAMLAEADWAVLAVIIHSQWQWSLRLFDVHRHEGAELMIRDRVAGFWRDYIDTGIQPSVDPTRDEAIVKKLFARDDGTELDLSGDNELPGLLDERAKLKDAIKLNEKRVGVIDTDIKGKLGNHTYARIRDGRRVSWKLQQRAGFTVQPTEFRVLRIAKN
jgi:predicted phage-related endonuclease